MPVFAAYRTLEQYSVVIAESRDAVWDKAGRAGVHLIGVTELKPKSSKTVTVRKLTAER